MSTYGDSSAAREKRWGPGLVPNVMWSTSTAVLKPYAGFQIRNIEEPLLVRDDRRYKRASMKLLQSAALYQNLSLRRKREMRARLLSTEIPR